MNNLLLTPADRGAARQHENTRLSAVLLNPFFPFTTAKVLALKATVLLLLTLLIKARIQIAGWRPKQWCNSPGIPTPA